jgi:uncharacterized YigZ family protein
MQTIKSCVKNEIIIKNSKFITLLYYINNENDVFTILKNLKLEYKNANHYCYAYIISNIKRANDDGEPTGTAGIPILSVLEHNNLTNIVCIVIRYFGGIKLGAGGLIRAYSKSVREALKISEFLTINKCNKITIKFTYDHIKNVDMILNNVDIIKKDFNENIEYVIRLNDDELNKIDQLLLESVIIIKKEEDYYLI